MYVWLASAAGKSGYLPIFRAIKGENVALKAICRSILTPEVVEKSIPDCFAFDNLLFNIWNADMGNFPQLSDTGISFQCLHCLAHFSFYIPLSMLSLYSTYVLILTL